MMFFPKALMLFSLFIIFTKKSIHHDELDGMILTFGACVPKFSFSVSPRTFYLLAIILYHENILEFKSFPSQPFKYPKFNAFVNHDDGE